MKPFHTIDSCRVCVFFSGGGGGGVCRPRCSYTETASFCPKTSVTSVILYIYFIFIFFLGGGGRGEGSASQQLQKQLLSENYRDLKKKL